MLYQILTGAIFLLGVACWLTGIDTGSSTLHTMTISFVFFALPMIGAQLVIGISTIMLPSKRISGPKYSDTQSPLRKQMVAPI